jgi:Holliday junction resolvase RusA-like endonuclease
MTDPLLAAFIPGDPVPFARPRFNHGRAFQSPEYAAWKRGAALILRAAMAGRPRIERQPLYLVVEVYHSRPTARPEHVDADEWRLGLAAWAITRSDTDNHVKAVGDALQDGGVIEDDRWIARIEASSQYAPRGGRAGVNVVLEAA